jgi:hypothetical protein
MKNLARLRSLGWSVAVHNDYKINGLPMTFWLLTHPSGRWVKGEAASDEEALEECLANAIECPCCLAAKEPEKGCICSEECPNS